MQVKRLEVIQVRHVRIAVRRRAPAEPPPAKAGRLLMIFVSQRELLDVLL